MVALFDLPFRSDEIRDPDGVHAVVTVARRRHPGSSSGEKHMGAFGAVLCSNNRPIWTSWGVGYAESEDIVRAYGILHLLNFHCGGLKLIVRCKGLKDQLAHVSFSQGYKSNGLPFDGYSVLKPVQRMMRERKWELRPWSAATNRGRRLAEDAADLALEIAFNYKPFVEHIEPDHPRHFLFETEMGVVGDSYFDEPARLLKVAER